MITNKQVLERSQAKRRARGHLDKLDVIFSHISAVNAGFELHCAEKENHSGTECERYATCDSSPFSVDYVGEKRLFSFQSAVTCLTQAFNTWLIVIGTHRLKHRHPEIPILGCRSPEFELIILSYYYVIE